MSIIAEGWVASTNDLIEYLDDELITVRKNAYETAISLNKNCENLDKNTKETGRLKEKSRLAELRAEMESLRKDIAKLAYQSKFRTMLCAFEIAFLVLSFIPKGNLIGILLCSLGFLMGLSSLIATYVRLKKKADKIIQACSRYGVIEANIKIFDYRELETIDLEKLPFYRAKYSKADLGS